MVVENFHKKMMYGEPGGRKVRGRQSLRWLNDLEDDLRRTIVERFNKEMRNGDPGGRKVRRWIHLVKKNERDEITNNAEYKGCHSNKR
ncbi:hypothetical protein O3M35_003345 [Rhynocoris fuscipes]|uniref:Uncharacterized protein n=1 Tax=Rhynocoris fuscipes TaxID=488301 RepID=A0AAW1CJR4_9HEMI